MNCSTQSADSGQIVYSKYIFDKLHLQIIETISPKASVQNSSDQWAIFSPEDIAVIKEYEIIMLEEHVSYIYYILVHPRI